MKIEDLDGYITNDMLDLVYMSREESLHKKCKKDKEEIKLISDEYPSEYETVINAINELPLGLEKEKEKIIEFLDEFCMKKEIIADYENEKFYKAGFCDGVRMIIESIKSK